MQRLEGRDNLPGSDIQRREQGADGVAYVDVTESLIRPSCIDANGRVRSSA